MVVLAINAKVREKCKGQKEERKKGGQKEEYSFVKHLTLS
jgi:hypothetical protein